MPVIVDERLDRKFLTLLGRYVATCGRIEAELWHITLIGQDEKLSTSEGANQAMSNQSRLDNLMEAVTHSLADTSDQTKSEVSEIVAQIEAEKWVRHMAIHGHWWMENDVYRVRYFRNFGTRKNPSWKNRDGHYTFDELLDALNAADKLLMRIIESSEKIFAEKLCV